MTIEHILAFDVGEKRIGVAFADSQVKLASPLPALRYSDDIALDIIRLAIDKKADVLVIGNPRNNRGDETVQTDFCQKVADQIIAEISDRQLAIKVAMQDESLTSVIAEQRLRSRRNFKPEMLRDGTIDSEAATIILEDYLGENYG